MAVTMAVLLVVLLVVLVLVVLLVVLLVLLVLLVVLVVLQVVLRVERRPVFFHETGRIHAHASNILGHVGPHTRRGTCRAQSGSGTQTFRHSPNRRPVPPPPPFPNPTSRRRPSRIGRCAARLLLAPVPCVPGTQTPMVCPTPSLCSTIQKFDGFHIRIGRGRLPVDKTPRLETHFWCLRWPVPSLTTWN